jgi:hypothetical protein
MTEPRTDEKPEYEQPVVVDFGTVAELTQADFQGHASDVPKGYPFHIFS